MVMIIKFKLNNESDMVALFVINLSLWNLELTPVHYNIIYGTAKQSSLRKSYVQ